MSATANSGLGPSGDDEAGAVLRDVQHQISGMSAEYLDRIFNLADELQEGAGFDLMPIIIGGEEWTRIEAGLTQRALGKRLRKPQSWVFNCETANRRVDVTELIAWCVACGVDPHRAVDALTPRAKR